MHLLPEIINKRVLPLLMLPFIAVPTLKLIFEMVEHALRVAWRWGVDQIFHWIGQHVVLHSRTRKISTAHTFGKYFDKTEKCFAYFVSF